MKIVDFVSPIVQGMFYIAITMGGLRWLCRFFESLGSRLTVRKIGRTNEGNSIFEVDPHILWYQNDLVNLGPGLAFILKDDFKESLSISQVDTARKYRQLFRCYGDEDGEALFFLDEAPGPKWSLDYFLENLVLAAIRKFYFPRRRNRSLKRLLTPRR